MLGAALPLGQGSDRDTAQFVRWTVRVHGEAGGWGGPVTTEYAVGIGLFEVGEHGVLVVRRQPGEWRAFLRL